MMLGRVDIVAGVERGSLEGLVRGPMMSNSVPGGGALTAAAPEAFQPRGGGTHPLLVAPLAVAAPLSPPLSPTTLHAEPPTDRPQPRHEKPSPPHPHEQQPEPPPERAVLWLNLASPQERNSTAGRAVIPAQAQLQPPPQARAPLPPPLRPQPPGGDRVHERRHRQTIYGPLCRCTRCAACRTCHRRRRGGRCRLGRHFALPHVAQSGNPRTAETQAGGA